MPKLPPADSLKEEVATEYSIAEISIARNPDGFSKSSFTIKLHYGFEKSDIDSKTNYQIFDPIEADQLFVSLSLPELENNLQSAVKEGGITEDEMNSHLKAILEMDAQLVALAEAAVELYCKAGMCCFPVRVSRFIP